MMRFAEALATKHAPTLPASGARGALAAAVALGAALSISSCGDSTPPTAAVTVEQVVAQVTVTPDSVAFAALGDTVRVAGTAVDGNGHGVPGAEISWSTSDDAVATVDTGGLVTAVGNGVVAVAATSGSASGTAAVTVEQLVAQVTVTPDSVAFGALGDTVRVAGAAVDGNGHGVPGVEISWSTSDDAVATVDAGGLVTAVGNGAVTLAATSGSASGTAAVTVEQVVSDVAVSPAADTLQAFGDTLRFFAEATDANGHALAGSEFSWASSDTLVARVDRSGLVESVATGTAVVTATASDVAGAADVRVVGTACTTYFELTYDDGSTDCIRVPRVVYTFTPRGGRPLIESSWDPTEVIRIHFDSEVVYLSESGEWRDISKADILDMVEISGKLHDDIDHVSADGSIGLDLVSVSNAGGRTIITIDSPYDPRTWEGKIYDQLAYGNYERYNIIVNNFARAADASKIARSNSVASYLEDTRIFYHGEFGARYHNATSCDLEYMTSTASRDDVELDALARAVDYFTDTNFLLPGIGAFDGATSSLTSERSEYDKADPGTRYVIDIAFIVSVSLLANASGDWRGYLEDTVLGLVNLMFQDSGVNVEFRASVISPFSEYSADLLCDLPSLENLVIARKREGRLGWGKLHGDEVAILEVVPSIRRNHPVDIVVAMIANGGSYAALLPPVGISSYYAVPRWESYAVVGPHDNFLDLDGLYPGLYKIGTANVARILAHELGHVLGLHHDIDSLVDVDGYSLEVLKRPRITATRVGFGYGGDFSGLPYGTIMSAVWFPRRGIPLFSADREMLRSDLCGDGDTAVGMVTALDTGYCYHSEPHPDIPIRLGGPYKYGITADASEGLQYAIPYVSEYYELSAVSLELLTVSNAVAAKTLRARH